MAFCESFPARFILVFLGFWGSFLQNAQKINLSVAIVAMVKRITVDNETFVPQCILEEPSMSVEVDLTEGEFLWDEFTQGLILGAYYVGFMFTQIPGSRLAEVVGAKKLYGFGTLGTSILSLLTPMAANYSLELFIAIRMMIGLIAGAIYPVMHMLLIRWIPHSERNFLSSVVYGGLSVGNFCTLLLSGLLSESAALGGWASAFYVFGVAGVIWFVLWSYFIYDRPSMHPRLSNPERLYLLEIRASSEKTGPVPWKDLLMSKAVWALIVAHSGHVWGMDTLLLELPTYLRNITGISISQSGLISAIPFLFQAVFAWIAAFVADAFLRASYFRVSTVRKGWNTIAFFGAAACFLSVAFAGCHYKVVTYMLFLTMGFDGISKAGFFVNHMDLSPDFAGTLMGLTNSIACMNGFVVPYVVAALTQNQQTVSRWSIVFIISAVVYVVTGMVFVAFGSTETQSWGTVHHTMTEVRYTTSGNSKDSSIVETSYTTEKTENSKQCS